jgi:hypothetical protein
MKAIPPMTEAMAAEVLALPWGEAIPTVFRFVILDADYADRSIVVSSQPGTAECRILTIQARNAAVWLGILKALDAYPIEDGARFEARADFDSLIPLAKRANAIQGLAWMPL